jgi:hypothetical protein
VRPFSIRCRINPELERANDIRNTNRARRARLCTHRQPSCTEFAEGGSDNTCMPDPASHDLACGTWATTSFVADWTLRCWAAAADGSQDPAASFDFYSIDPSRPVGRIVVLDAAVAPWHNHDAIFRSAALALDALAAPGDLVEGFARVDQLLHNPELPRRHDNIIFSGAACQINWASGEAHVVVAGDCEIWVRRNSHWFQLAASDVLELSARKEYEQLSKGMAENSNWDLQRELLDDPSQWNRPPLGLGTGRFTSFTVRDIDGVVVSSDGARLRVEQIYDLDTWLTDGIHSTHPRPDLPHPHGDICVISAQRTHNATSTMEFGLLSAAG